MGPKQQLAAVILAAGGSTRLGEPKQIKRLGRSGLLWQSVTLAASAAQCPVTVVVGAYRGPLRRLLNNHPARPRVISHRGWRSGLAGSLVAGIRSLGPRSAAALILLCDQPRLLPADIARLIQAWAARPGRIAAAGYAGITGVPVIFPRRVWNELKALEGDRGAGPLLKLNPGRVTRVPMPRAAFDVDSLDDLR